MKIQFLLLSDGPSHKLLGINVVNGLKRLGIEAEYFFSNRKAGQLLKSPAYVFCLKPRDDDFLVAEFKKRGSKVALILNDEQLPYNRSSIYDFAVSPSIVWKRMWESKHEKPCYLIKEEFDYYFLKKHQEESIRVVTVGYSENLKKHLMYVPTLAMNFDFTIVSERQVPEFKNAKFKKFQPDASYYFEKDYDKMVIEQFREFNVGIITQDSSGSTSNRLKSLLYAGLPVICSRTENHSDLWFNQTEMKIDYFSSSIVDIVNSLGDFQKRQEIVDFNYSKISRYGGIEASGKSFLEAIEMFENFK